MRYNKTWQGASQVEIQLDLLKNKWTRYKKFLRLLLHYNIGPRLNSLKLGSDQFLYRILLSQWKWNDCAMVLVETIRWWKWTVKLKILWQLKENIREIKTDIPYCEHQLHHKQLEVSLYLEEPTWLQLDFVLNPAHKSYQPTIEVHFYLICWQSLAQSGKLIVTNIRFISDLIPFYPSKVLLLLFFLFLLDKNKMTTYATFEIGLSIITLHRLPEIYNFYKWNEFVEEK